MKEIIINSAKHGIHKVKVDDEDYDDLIKITWHLSRGRMSLYALTNVKNEKGIYKLLGMHRYIMKVSDTSIHVDHKDFDGLNNQKNNLRECNRSQNSMNGRTFGVSKYLGVSPTIMKRNYGNHVYKYWKASIGINRQQKYLGIFPYTPEGEIEAALTYDKAAKELFGEFANLNFKKND